MKALNKEKSVWIILGLMCLCSSVIRAILAIKMGTVSIIYDELLYWDISKSIVDKTSILMRGLMVSNKDILYSLLISWVHMFKNIDMAYNATLILNAIIMSTVVFPVYIMAYDILKNKKLSVFIALISIIMPEMFYTTKLLQENLYYPLMMWAFCFFVHCIMKKPYDLKRVGIYVCYLSVLVYVKNIGLCVIVGFILFYVILIFLEKDKNQKRKIPLMVIEIAAIYLILKKIMDSIITNVFSQNGENAVSSLSQSTFNRMLDVKSYINYIYPIITYVAYGILLFGIFTVIISIAYFKYLNQKEQALLIFNICVLATTLGVVCLLILQADQEVGEKITRLHMRYFYYAFLPFLILFIRLYNVIRVKGMIPACWVLSVIYGILIIICPSEIKQGSQVDSIAANSLQAFFMTAVRQKGLKILIIIGIIVGCWLIYKKYCKALYACVCLVLLALCIHSTQKAYSVSMWERNALEGMKTDGDLLTQELSDKVEGMNDVLIVAVNKATSGVMETHLEILYRVCQIDDLLASGIWNDGQINYNKLDFYGMTKYNLTEHYEPRYLIVQGSIQVPNYEVCDSLSLQNFILYQRKENK